MKKIIIISLFAMTFLTCAKDADYIGEEVMLVASSISVVDNPSELGSKFYMIKTGSDPSWKFYSISSIEGFEFKEGYESVIIVKVYRNFPDNEPIMDMSQYRYKLKKIISQVKKDSDIQV